MICAVTCLLSCLRPESCPICSLCLTCTMTCAGALSDPHRDLFRPARLPPESPPPAVLAGHNAAARLGPPAAAARRGNRRSQWPPLPPPLPPVTERSARHTGHPSVCQADSPEGTVKHGRESTKPDSDLSNTAMNASLTSRDEYIFMMAQLKNFYRTHAAM